MGHTGPQHHVLPIVMAHAAAGQHMDDLTVALVGVQPDGRACRQRQRQDAAHAVLHRRAYLSLPRAALEMGHHLSRRLVKIQYHSALLSRGSAAFSH